MRDAFRRHAAFPSVALRLSIALLVLTAMPSILPLPVQGAAAQQALTNADVVKMVQAHLGVDVIVGQVRSNPGNYSLTTDSLIRLKQQGVPDAVIVAMQAKKGVFTPPSSTSAPAESDQPTSKWLTQTRENKFSGAHIREAILSQPFHDGRDLATVTATCGLVTTRLRIVYTTPDKDLHFKVFTPDPTVFLGQVFSHQQRVTVRVRIDKGQIVTVSPTTEYLNEATLQFFAGPGDGSSMPVDPGVVGSRKRLYQANDVRIELPLNDGERPFVDIKPQDPSFQQFALGCPVSDGEDTGLTDNPAGPSYTADQFAAVVPAVLRKAAVAHGFDSHGYDQELEYITAAVKTCAQITPQMAAGGTGMWRRFGLDYQICEGLDSYRHMPLREFGFEDVSMASGHVQGTPYATHPTRPDVGLKIYQPQGHHWIDGKGFYVSIEVLEFASDDGQSDRFDTLLKDAHIAASTQQSPGEAESPGAREPQISSVSGGGSVVVGSPGHLVPVVRVEGSVQQAKLIKQTPAVYPPLAKNAGVQGVVRFQATIGVDGLVKNLQLLSGPHLLVQSAVQAVSQWQYQPTMLNGSPVQVITTVDVNFTLAP